MRSVWLIQVLGVVLALMAAGFARAQEASHVALVFGNSKYIHAGPLANPGNDAEDLSLKLESMGYKVDTFLDADFNQMRNALSAFAAKAARADVAVLFFAGHGIEISKQNYLIPVDAKLESDNQVAFQTIPMDMMMNAVSGAKKLKVVLLDACRNNPFLKKMRSAGVARRSTLNGGLAAVDPDHGSLIGYSAKEGTTASDGVGRNSPYTTALLKHISEPRLDIGRMMRKIRDDVIKATGGEQEPFDYGSLPGADVFLHPAALTEEATDGTDKSPGNTPQPDAGKPDPEAQRLKFASEAWAAVKDSTIPGDFEIVEREFAGTFYAKLAQSRREALLGAQKAPDAPEKEEEGGTTEQPVPQTRWHLALYRNVDLFGNDLGKGLKVGDATQCASSCGDNTACRAFTYNAAAGLCFLKGGYSFAQVFSGALAGFYFQGTGEKDAPSIVAEWEVFAKADISGTDLGDSGAQTFDGCMETCRSRSGCDGFAFVHFSKRRQCWLKANAGEPVYNASSRKGVTSGRQVNRPVYPDRVIEVDTLR